jgi:hypothetical protein
MRKLLPLLVFVALVGGACGDRDGESESASVTTGQLRATTTQAQEPSR